MELEKSGWDGYVRNMTCYSFTTDAFLGRHLYAKMKEALEMSRKQRAAHSALTATFPPDTIQEWTNMIIQWQEDPDKPNPFEEKDISK